MNKPLACAATLVSAALAALPAQAAKILGVDVTSGQGSINWTDVYSSGVVFAYARATQGTVFEDPDYNTNMTDGKAAGLQMGAYEFAEPDVNTPAQEANYFWNFAGSKIKSDGKSLSPAIDFEIFSGHDGTATYTEWFNDWAADVKAKTTAFMHPVIIVSPCGGACDLTTNITLASWIINPTGSDSGSPWTQCTACNAWDPNGTGDWTYWLFSDSGAISGISGKVDLDAYNGDLASLKSSEGVGGK